MLWLAVLNKGLLSSSWIYSLAKAGIEAEDKDFLCFFLFPDIFIGIYHACVYVCGGEGAFVVDL